MPSPFPGMDPYLEDPQFWGGVHTRLITAIDLALSRALPPGYFADVDEHVWLQAADPDDRRVLGKPDVFVAETAGGESGRAATAELAPPVVVTLPKGRRRTQRFVKIVGPGGAKVVTVVELLSPANKEGDDRDAYLAKRAEYFAARVNLVEIDLLRGGERMPLGRPAPQPADYYIFVSRGPEYPRAGVWPVSVREPLPRVPVPLRPADGDLPLDLQRLITGVYDDYHYADRVDYSGRPKPLLRKADAEWAAEWLRSRTGGA